MKNTVNSKKTISVFLMAMALGVGIFAVPAFADTIVSTGPDYPYFRSSDNPVAAVFYFVGDLLAAPFRFIGSLID